MKLKINVVNPDESKQEVMHQLIVNTFKYYAKQLGVAKVINNLDSMCLAIAQGIGYTVDRQDNVITFTYKGQ